MSLIAGRQISGSVASASYATTASFALNGGGGSIETGSFATTGSNTFKGNQTISGSVYLNSGSVIQSTGADIFIKAGVGVNGGVSLYNNNSTQYLAVDDTGSYANKFTVVDRLTVQGLTNIQNQIVSGSITFAGGAKLTNEYDYPSIDLQAGPGGYAELLSNNTQTYIWVTNENANIVTSGSYYWGFDATGSTSMPGRVTAPSFTGSLLGTASYATTSSYVLNSISSSFTTTASYALNAVSSSLALNAISSSYSATSSYALNGGVTKILAGPNINLSPVNGLGDVTVTSFGTNLYNTATGSYGSFHDTGSILASSATAIYSMSLSTTDISNGVFISASSGDMTRIKFTNAGTYNVQFSSQFSNTDSSIQDVVVWVRKNEIDVPDSSGTVGVPPFKAGSNGQVIASWNYYLNLSANDYIQLCWHVEQANVIMLETIAAGTTPPHPRTPSTILTAQRVDTFLSNTGSFSGSFVGIATTASYVLNAVSSSFASTASYVQNAQSASYVLQAISSSFASTASYVQFEGKPLSPGYPNNYILPVRTSTGNISLAAGNITDSPANIRYYPIQLSRDTLVSSIGALVRGTLATTTGSYRLGIYNSTEASSSLVQGATALPGTLLGDYGVISQNGAAQAFVEILFAPAGRPTLKKGEIYWLAISPSGSTTTAVNPTNGTVWNDYFGATPSTTTIATYLGLGVTADAGAGFPNPANITSSLTLITNTNSRPFPMLKITGSIM